MIAGNGEKEDYQGWGGFGRGGRLASAGRSLDRLKEIKRTSSQEGPFSYLLLPDKRFGKISLAGNQLE